MTVEMGQMHDGGRSGGRLQTCQQENRCGVAWWRGGRWSDTLDPGPRYVQTWDMVTVLAVQCGRWRWMSEWIRCMDPIARVFGRAGGLGGCASGLGRQGRDAADRMC